MYKDASGYITQILELLNEIDSYNYYKSQIAGKLDRLFEMYQRGKIDSIRYDSLRRKILKGKTKKEIITYYNSYIMLLLKQIQNYNTLIVDSVYNIDIDEVIAGMKIEVAVPAPEVVPKAVPKAAPEVAAKPLPEKPATVEIKVREAAKEEKVKQVKLKEIGIGREKLTEKPVFIKPSKKEKHSLLQRFICMQKSLVSKTHLRKMRKIQARADKKRAELLKAEAKRKEKLLKAEAKKKVKPKIKPLHPEIETVSFFRTLTEVFKPKPKVKEKIIPKNLLAKKPETLLKKGLFARVTDKIRSVSRKEKIRKPALIPKKFRPVMPEGEGIHKLSIRNVIKDWMDHLRKKEESLAEEPLISPSLIRLADVSLQEFQQNKEERLVDPEHLLREAKKIKSRLAKQKVTPIYKPILIGSIANLTVRGFTNYLIGKFPRFFKNLYHSLRLANIQVLSNTYANIMVFFMMIISVISFLVYTIFAILAFQPLLIAIIFGLIVASICASVTGFAFYFYPNTKITTRSKNIKTNLPFAMNHIAAIASSGVPPVSMFKLIAESMEYGEVCTEMHKIVDYIDLFGYNLVTAVRSVASLTPEEGLREFFEGIINTIESGGDFEKYLMAKSKEAMSSYEIERKKYAETVSTYSDIYTGILIAAPLFFVAALTLVSMLGGQIGGMNVSVIIGLGTYLVIPFLNVAFIIFLNISQPEV
ncbi:MAG: type II secretion system F family protein [Nanoarchaeota archaeon]|nr:type II secretion system F family protein [Nanoarchaeota archaeon]